MASDSAELSHRKHRRSPSEDENNDSQAPSKRRKHRHHKHHRHHHRHHRSKEEDEVEDARAEAEVEIGEKREEERKRNEKAVAVSGSILGIDYDVEEGEILEGDEDGGEVKKKKELGSDADIGEIGGLGAVCSDNSYMVCSDSPCLSFIGLYSLGKFDYGF